MDDSEATSLEPIRAFLAGSCPIRFKAHGNLSRPATRPILEAPVRRIWPSGLRVLGSDLRGASLPAAQLGGPPETQHGLSTHTTDADLLGQFPFVIRGFQLGPFARLRSGTGATLATQHAKRRLLVRIGKSAPEALPVSRTQPSPYLSLGSDYNMLPPRLRALQLWTRVPFRCLR